MSKRDTAFVTGGASGIGIAIAGALLDEGWGVVVVDVARAAFDEAAEQLAGKNGRVCFEQLDVADEDAVANVVARTNAQFGPLTVAINSAGIGADLFCLDTSASLFRKILDINLVGSFVVSREVAKCMRDHGGGSIVNIASVSGIRGNTGRVAYGASKGGVITMTKVMASELAHLGIRVNAIAPGPIETPLVARVHTDHVRAEWARTVPLRRYGTTDEIAQAAVFLVDERRSAYITGQTISVDGGFTAAGIMSEPA